MMETARIVYQAARLVMIEGLAETQHLDGRWVLNEYPLRLNDDDGVYGSLLIQGHGIEDADHRTWWSITIEIHLDPDKPRQVELGADIWIEPRHAKARMVGEEEVIVPDDDPAFLTEPFVRKWVRSFVAMITAGAND